MKALLMIGMLAAIVGTLSAQDAKPSDAQAKLDALQIKLEHTARRVNQPTASGSSVVGLRGSQQTSAKTLYWKQKETDVPVSPEEVKLFRSAVEQARSGQTSVALTGLRSFKSQYPKSALLPDVDETIQLLEHP